MDDPLEDSNYSCNIFDFIQPFTDLPKYKNNRQCNLRDVICLREHQRNFFVIFFFDSIMSFLFQIDIFASLRVPSVDVIDVNDTLFGMDCECLPSCSEQIYEVETTICQRNKFSKLRPIILGWVEQDTS